MLTGEAEVMGNQIVVMGSNIKNIVKCTCIRLCPRKPGVEWAQSYGDVTQLNKLID
jgi:hypothetical protein